ncbi:hypothetical protein ZWY2020_026833 [Hordeum vulgare]|nr:hypothetical protein ZWY2020_026833 [Hordeum vulgare]
MTMETLVEEILREILLRLPTRDVGRGHCVSKQWRGLLRDPYFVGLHAHANHVVSGAAAEALLVSMTHTLGCSLELTVFNVSTAATMCVVAGHPDEYIPTNACNGFLLLAANDYRRMPVFVCNPITGDKLRVLPPPLRSGTDSRVHCEGYALGYSPSTRQYKLFHLSFSTHGGLHELYVHVLTLGAGADGGVWRRHRGCYRCHQMVSAPALIDHKLHVLCKKWEHDTKPNRLLVVDVASETHRMYCLPGYTEEDAVADVLDLHGRLCVAVYEVGPRRGKLYFWVVRPQAPHGGSLYLSPLIWEMRYCFDMGATGDFLISLHAQVPTCVWLDDDDGMLYYLYGNRVYKHDTTKGRRRQGCRKAWDDQLQLLLPNDRWWNVFSGYRPNLLSPQDLAIAPQKDEERFEHRVLHALRCHKPSKNHGDSPQIDDGQPAAKLQ